MNVLALDLGTSAVKAAVIDAATGNPLAPPVKAAYDIDRPTPDAAEVDPAAFWAAADDAARRAVAAAPNARVEGVGLSCLTPALILLDAADRPLGPMWVHLDRRARPQARRLLQEHGDAFLAEVGNRPLPGGISALCYATQAEADPSLAGKVRSYLHANSWVGLRLTGERRFDPANASFTGLFGTLTTSDWSDRWCDTLGVSRRWLPPVIDGAATLGGLLPEIAQGWGLTAGIPVKLGTADTSSAMLAAGIRPGELLHVVGTTQVLSTIAPAPTPDPRRLTRRLGVGDTVVYVTHNPVGGVALDWVHDVCFAEQAAETFYGRTIPACAGRETPVTLDPPFLGGDRLEIDARTATLTGLSLGATREDILAAVLAGLARGHDAAFAALECGEPTRVVLTGGGADAVRPLLRRYDGVRVDRLDEGSLRGVGRLFA